MALTGKEEIEVEIKCAADKFFDIFRRSAHHIPNICPDKIQGIEVHHGDWETTGSVKHWNYVLDEKAELVKEKIESIDEEKKLVVFNVHDGDIMKHYKVFKATLHVTPKGEDVDASLVKWTIDYEKLNDAAPPPSKYLEFASAVTKDIDSHLHRA